MAIEMLKINNVMTISINDMFFSYQKVFTLGAGDMKQQ